MRSGTVTFGTHIETRDVSVEWRWATAPRTGAGCADMRLCRMSASRTWSSTARPRGGASPRTNEALRIAREAGARTVDPTSRPNRAAAHRLCEQPGFRALEPTGHRFAVEPTRRVTARLKRSELHRRQVHHRRHDQHGDDDADDQADAGSCGGGGLLLRSALGVSSTKARNIWVLPAGS